MKELFLPYELAVIAKEKGFNEDCFNCYESNGDLMGDDYYAMVKRLRNNNPNPLYTPAPLYQQIVDWFWEVHKIEVQPCYQVLGKWEALVSDENGKTLLHLLPESNREYCRMNAIREAFKLIS